jgi:hypothetical protein
MSKVRKIPAAFAVVSPSSAAKLATTEGKLALMVRGRELTQDGELILKTLLHVMQDGTDSNKLRAAEILLNYCYGKPVETKLVADTSPGGSTAPPQRPLSSEQLEAVVRGEVIADAEIVAPAPDVPSVPDEPTEL